MSIPIRFRMYLEQGDGCCNCHGYSVEGGPFEQEGLFVTQDVWCSVCSAEWTNVFKLVSIKNFKIEDVENEVGED